MKKQNNKAGFSRNNPSSDKKLFSVRKLSGMITLLAAMTVFAAACGSSDSDDDAGGLQNTTTTRAPAATTTERDDAATAAPPPATTQRPTTVTTAPSPATTSPAPAAVDGLQNITLTILHNNDGESKLLPDLDSGFPGIARFVAELKQQQQNAVQNTDGVITLTSGDNFLASKEFFISLNKGAPYYDSTALSGIYDAMALGNHDFDFSPDVTVEFVRGFEPAVPFLSANIDIAGEPAFAELRDEGRFAPSTVLERQGRKIGVIGAVTPQLPNISSPRGIIVNDVAENVNREAARLQGQGVNIIILVSHLQGVDEERRLVPQLRNVDIVIAGGGDELLRNDRDTCMPDAEPYGTYPIIENDADGLDIPVITAPGGYRCIGNLRVSFNGNGIMTNYAGNSLGVDLYRTPDSKVKSNVEGPLGAEVSALSSNILGVSEVGLDGRKPEIRTRETNVGKLVADALIYAASTRADGYDDLSGAHLVAITNGGGIRNDSIIPAGNFSVSTSFDISPFQNRIGFTLVPRDTLKNVLEHGIGALPSADGQFPHLSGFKVTYDLSEPARELDTDDDDCPLVGNPGSRVRSVVLDDGTVIVSDGEVMGGPDVLVVTNNFLAGGGDCYDLADLDFTLLGVTDQQAVAAYVKDGLNGTIGADKYSDGTPERLVPAS